MPLKISLSPLERNSQNQEMILASFAGNQKRSYDTECPNSHPILSTLKLRGIELYQEEMVNYIPS